MIKVILFDLDDTLLGNEVDSFMSGYFGLLSDYARPIMDPGQFIEKLVAATQATIRNTDPTQTNADIFWARFLDSTDLDRAELEPFFASFYETEFPQLRSTTQVVPAARDVVQHSLDKRLKVVIATNPLFPLVAIEQRLDWAGVPTTSFDYALVTSYENMHAAKPQPAYYEEILTKIGVQPGEALMVGDDWKNDIIPASLLGMHTYWVADSTAPEPESSDISGRGSLAELNVLIIDGWLGTLNDEAAIATSGGYTNP